MKQYLELLDHIMSVGRTKPDRSGFGLRSTFGYQTRYNLQEGFPLLTTKRMPFKIIAAEMLWFISGSSNIKLLHEHNCKIWDTFADPDGELGRVYGVQWRHWRRPDGSEFDQLAWAINEIKTNPASKAIIVSAWNAGELNEMRLPPCHTMFQFYVRKNELSMQLYQRSADAFLGVPFNIAEYAMLLMMVAQVTGKVPFEFVHTIGDAHIYKNHKEQVVEQLKRKPHKLPTLKLNPAIKDIDKFTIDDFTLEGYEFEEHIKAPLVEL